MKLIIRDEQSEDILMVWRVKWSGSGVYPRFGFFSTI